MKDFFISYTQADLARARWINDLLEAEGYSTVAQFKDMPPGSNFVIEMDEAVKQARQTIAVLSPEYLASDYCQQELATVIRNDPKGKKRLLIPVHVRRCDPEGLLGPIVYIDLVGKDDETAKELLLSGVKGQTPAQAEPPPDNLLQKYFDQIKEKYGKITLLGETETHEMKRVFVELTINEYFSRPTANSEWMGMWDAELRKRYDLFGFEPDEEREAQRRIKPEDLLKRRSPAVIAGAPGCGKTTLMRWLALQVCDENLKRVPIFVELKGLNQKSFESADVRLDSVLFDHAVSESLKKLDADEGDRKQLQEELSRPPSFRGSSTAQRTSAVSSRTTRPLRCAARISSPNWPSRGSSTKPSIRGRTPNGWRSRPTTSRSRPNASAAKTGSMLIRTSWRPM